MLLLSPPDTNDAVLKSVCRLGSLLRTQGFDVAVDQWSRTEQSSLGPVPWLHSQMLNRKQYDNRVVIVLTPNGLEKIEEWAHRCEEVAPKREDRDDAQMLSPYSDVFTASLSILQADRQRGRAAEHFLLVKFDSCPVNDRRNLPEVLQGLPLFQLPSQTQALLTDLSVRKPGQTSGKRSRSERKRSVKTKMDQTRKKSDHVLIQCSEGGVYK